MTAISDLPLPAIHRVTWDSRNGGIRWAQYHDESEPLPAKWDEEEPDLIEGFYSADQMRAVRQQERERAAKLCEAQMEKMLDCQEWANGAFACAAAIRGTP